jgi:hypothetical protein
VLRYNTPLKKTGTSGAGDTTADRVFGQNGSFSANICHSGLFGTPNPHIDAFCFPGGVALDAKGNLYVADEVNNRVLRLLP